VTPPRKPRGPAGPSAREPKARIPVASSVVYAVVIPARYGSKRLPAKALLAETGKPLVQHTAEQAARAPGVARVIVATDDDRIEAAVRRFGGEVARTDAGHESGTSRCAEVAGRKDLDGIDVIVNVQGDEPQFEPDDLARLAQAAARPGVDVATLAHPIATPDEASKQSLVKVVLRADGTALYFSRSPIPFDRERGRAADGALGHVGIYAFRRQRLLDYVRLPESRLATLESLEQLRALEAGWTIAVLLASRPAAGIDTPEDYRRFVETTLLGILDK
jgi:3-deoxy-D-manno-octulosonate cytidylyltransferase